MKKTQQQIIMENAYAYLCKKFGAAYERELDDVGYIEYDIMDAVHVMLERYTHREGRLGHGAVFTALAAWRGFTDIEEYDPQSQAGVQLYTMYRAGHLTGWDKGYGHKKCD